jgi:Rrf2 family protein
MLSKKTKYALKAVLYLARKYDTGPILISDLAQEERIPKKFLELILLTMKNNGILQSRKGKGGGYYLGKPPEEISIGKVIRILEGPIALVPCVSESAYAPCPECFDGRTCGIKLIMKDIRDATAKILDDTSLADMLEREEKVKHRDDDILNYAI